MAKRVTIADVAARAGVSKTAVSLILNQRPGTRLPEETAERVRTIAAELQYRPNLHAQVLRSGKTRTVGFISDEVTVTRYASAMIRGLLDVAEERDHTVLIAETGERPERVLASTQAMLDRQPDALIFGFLGAREVELPELPESLRVVMLNGVASRPTPAVLPDEYAAGRAMASALVHAGRVDGYVLIGAFPPGPIERRVSVTVQERFAGIDDVLAEAGLEPAVRMVDPYWTDPERGYRATARALQTGTRIRALIAANDNMAFGAYRALDEAGLRVPDDVSVVSFDDDVIASYMRPRLTTARLPYEEMGRLAMQLALDDDVPNETVLVPMPVQRRESV